MNYTEGNNEFCCEDFINILHEQSADGLVLNVKVNAVTTRFHGANCNGNGVFRNLTRILVRCPLLSKYHTV